MNKTEVTVQVFESFDNVKQKLISQGYEHTEDFCVNDYYFSKYDIVKLKEMEYKDIIDNSIIVRNLYDDKNSIEQKIVHKKKVLDANGNVIADSKVEVFVDDIEKIVLLFNQAGLTNWCSMKNNASTFIKGQIRLDTHLIEDLGLFIELEEFPGIENLSSEEKFVHLSNMIKELNINIGDDFSCKKVFMKFKKENN